MFFTLIATTLLALNILTIFPTAGAADNKKSVSTQSVDNGQWKKSFKAAMPAWSGKTYFIFLNGQWVGLFLLIFISFAFERFARLYVGSKVQTVLSNKNVYIDSKRGKTFALPFGIMALSTSWSIGIHLLEFSKDILPIFTSCGNIVFTVGGVWACHHFVDIVSLYFEKLSQKSENKFDDVLVPLLRKTAKVFVLCVGALFIGHGLNLNITNILAGLGIGGLAFALAAKDTLSNLFGSLTVILDRPFQINDWILIDSEIEGTVVEVGFRSTRIRTFYDSIISVPNNKLINVHIDNFGERRYRRYKTKISINYHTPANNVEAFCEGIRQIIINHPHTRKDYFHVYFSEMGDSALNILLYLFWQVPDWSTELAERHRLLIDILRLGEKLGIDFAFPTSTVHLFQGESVASKLDSESKDGHQAGKSAADQVLNNPICYNNHRSSLEANSKIE